LLYWSTAAGVEIICEDNTGSPEIAIAREIAPTVPPVGIAILPEKSTKNLALHWLVSPLRVMIPLPSLC